MRHRVVIVGGGFAGLTAALTLDKSDVEVTLLDRRNFHCFQPLLYQVATGGLSPANIAAPLRGILRKQNNTKVLLAQVERFDVARNVVISDLGEHPFDSLILCPGATHAYFGHDAWSLAAPGLKTLEDALSIRTCVLLAFERAEAVKDEAERHRLLTFVIVGGGPTGVELAGAIAELARHTLKNNFREFDPATARVLLLEGGDRILSSYPPALSEKALASLRRLGVEVCLGAKVIQLESGLVIYEQGGRPWNVNAGVILWGAGVQGSNLGKALAQATGISLDRIGRIPVNSHLSLPQFPHVFVAGDLAYLEQDGRPIPGVAPAAMQMGRYVARLIEAKLRGKTLKPFRYQDKGSMATIGRGAAVADLGWLRLSGYPAWLAWLFLHVLFLVGFESKILVLIQWAGNYLTRGRSARLIADDPLASHATAAHSPS